MSNEFADLTPTPSGLDREDLKGMSPEEIASAIADGRLMTLLRDPNYVRDRSNDQATRVAEAEAHVAAVSDAIRTAGDFAKFQSDPAAFIRAVVNETPAPRQLTREDLQSMTHEQINEARLNGQLKNLLGN